MATLIVAAVCILLGVAVEAKSFETPYSRVRGRPYNVSYDNRAIKINGERVLLQSGSIHYTRSTPDMWPDLFASSRAAGLNMMETYVFWNYHEVTRGQYDFSTESHNFTLFLKEAADAGMLVTLRLGPYVCAEWTNGGLPAWLHTLTNLSVRDDNAVWEQQMSQFLLVVAKLVEPYLARNGGPIALVQIENEYGNIESAYPHHAAYVKWAADFAVSTLNFGIPVIMCQQDDAPDIVIATCNGFYCDNWISGHAHTHPTQPHMWTENWPGWFQAWGEPRPHRPAEDVSFSVLRWVSRGGTHFNYYMWQGGTTFARWAGGPYDITSYDYDAPLNEYGLPNQPKYSHLSRLHELLVQYSPLLLGVDSIPSSQSLATNLDAIVYTYNGESVIFLSNIDASKSGTVQFQSHTYVVPAWSVLVVDGATMNVVYNSADTTASMLAQHQSDRRHHHHARIGEEQSSASSYSPVSVEWLSEPTSLRSDDPILSSTSPLEHVTTVLDRSDFLLYQTTVPISSSQAQKGYVTLSLTQVFDYVYVFWNGEEAGSARSVGSSAATFKLSVTKSGDYSLSLFVLTAGLTNYGANYFDTKRGLLGDVIVDGSKFTNQGWQQQIGLRGEEQQYYNTEIQHAWQPQSTLPVSRSFTWYAVNFGAVDPGVQNRTNWALDIHNAVGKGSAWCNGHAVGRYWNIIGTGSCAPCDYRGAYSSNNCRTNCGEETQRYYHVPRSWLRADADNICVLFEEQGATNPANLLLVKL